MKNSGRKTEETCSIRESKRSQAIASTFLIEGKQIYNTMRKQNTMLKWHRERERTTYNTTQHNTPRDEPAKIYETNGEDMVYRSEATK